jgi:hypothetical protein
LGRDWTVIEGAMVYSLVILVAAVFGFVAGYLK